MPRDNQTDRLCPNKHSARRRRHAGGCHFTPNQRNSCLKGATPTRLVTTVQPACLPRHQVTRGACSTFRTGMPNGASAAHDARGFRFIVLILVGNKR